MNMPIQHWKAKLPDIKICPTCKKDTGKKGFLIRYYIDGRIRLHPECVESFDQNR